MCAWPLSLSLLLASLARSLFLSLSADTTVISGYARAMQPDTARDVLQQMDFKGVAPNVLTYSALVDGFAVAGRVDEAAEWLRAAGRETG